MPGDGSGALGITRSVVLSLLLVSTSLPTSGARGDPPRLRVFAAASLTDVLESLASGFTDARVDVSLGGSSALARQIRDGAPVDVFVSASPDWIEDLREADAITGEAVVLARNRLVCVAPRGSPLAEVGDGLTAPEPVEPQALFARLDDGARLGIADPGVPAGEYARAALDRLGVLRDLERRLVGQKDVRAVLHAVEQGELVAGFVYATDAAVADVIVLFAFDAATHPAIEYQAVVPREAESPELARRFLVYLRSDSARAVLTRAGFDAP